MNQPLDSTLGMPQTCPKKGGHLNLNGFRAAVFPLLPSFLHLSSISNLPSPILYPS